MVEKNCDQSASNLIFSQQHCSTRPYIQHLPSAVRVSSEIVLLGTLELARLQLSRYLAAELRVSGVTHYRRHLPASAFGSACKILTSHLGYVPTTDLITWLQTVLALRPSQRLSDEALINAPTVVSRRPMPWGSLLDPFS